jgi:regulator of sirC expression with transglutaminase-like and TPR domain
MTKYVFLLLLGLTIGNDAYSQRLREVDRNIAVIRSILKLPDNQIDLAKIKIIIDRMIDPKLDGKATLKTLDDMAANVALMVSFNATSKEKIEALRAYLYQAGAWNNNQVFAYDLAGDPKGFKISNKLIANYLQSRKGNCVSMPLLMMVLGQKLGINVALVRAPEHLFARYTDESGQTFNLEATTGGGLKRDANYKSEFEISQKAIDNGLYLRSLSKKETITVMSIILAENYANKKEAENLMAMADFYLELNPKSLDGMLNKGYAYYLQLDRDFLKKYAAPKDIPVEKRAHYVELDTNNHTWYGKAESLGWREPSKEYQINYTAVVKKAAQQQKQ